METNASKAPPPVTAIAAITEPSTPQPKADLTKSTASQTADATGQKTSSYPTYVPAYISQPEEYRLVIEKDPGSGVFVYKTIDRYSGAVVNQFPREEVVQLGGSSTYKAGTVFTTKI
jgi:flagellar protein FlaG